MFYTLCGKFSHFHNKLRGIFRVFFLKSFNVLLCYPSYSWPGTYDNIVFLIAASLLTGYRFKSRYKLIGNTAFNRVSVVENLELHG